MTNINPKDDLDNPVKYVVSDYCKKYPDDQGNQRIHAEDVVRSRNHKWANLAEQPTWSLNIWIQSKNFSEAGAPTYGTCAECWGSVSSYQPCQECGKGLYMHLELRGYIIDSQMVGEKMEKPHHTARAGLAYNKARTDTMRFNCEAIT
jgi:hypothetical protein